MTEQEKQEIMQIANDIQAGELSRQRGSLNVEAVSRLFSWDIISKIGQQRIDAALYLYKAGYRKIHDGAEVVLVKGETAREQVERIIQLSEHCDINDIVVVTKMEYSDLMLTRNNYEHAKVKIEELQGVIEKQNEKMIRLAQAYTREKTKAEQIRKKNGR